jgi:hypothetical protein
LAINAQAPWHTESYHTFISEGLPALLADRVPLSSYEWSYPNEGETSLQIEVGGVRVTQTLPRPDGDGIFDLRESPAGNNGFRVVIPVPDSLDVANARIDCVGEQLATYLDARLGKAPEGVEWDQALVESWLPISEWINALLASEPTSQYLQNTNWLDRWTHIRRITLIPVVHERYVLDGSNVGQAYVKGLSCPIITPTGPNAGWILEIARGATIRNCRLVREADTEDREQDVGIGASFIPFVEHDDGTRVVFG